MMRAGDQRMNCKDPRRHDIADRSFALKPAGHLGRIDAEHVRHDPSIIGIDQRLQPRIGVYEGFRVCGVVKPF